MSSRVNASIGVALFAMTLIVLAVTDSLSLWVSSAKSSTGSSQAPIVNRAILTGGDETPQDSKTSKPQPPTAPRLDGDRPPAPTPQPETPSEKPSAPSSSTPSSPSTSAACRNVPELCQPLPKKMNAPLGIWAEGKHDDGQRSVKEGLLKEASSCRPKDNRRTASIQVKATSKAAVAGQWFRFWVVAMAGDGKPTCRSGDGIELSMESDTAKIAVDRVLDLGGGLHEVQVFIRKRGSYRVCADAPTVSPFASEDQEFRLSDDPSVNGTIGRVISGNINTVEPKSAPFCTPNTKWSEVKCATVEVTAGTDVVPASKESCTVSTHPDRFRAGGWVKLGEKACDGIHCSGGFSLLGSGGWVWASDHCVMRLFESQAEVRKEAMAGQWLVGWGPSTTKQPFSNLVEYRMGGKVFAVSMEQLHKWRGPPKRKPNFFSYRQWDVEVPSGEDNVKPSRVSMIWGGCPGIMAGPRACPDITGMRNRLRVASYLNPNSAVVQKFASSEDVARGPSPYPTGVVLDHFVWRAPLWDEHRFLEILDDTVNAFLKPNLANLTATGKSSGSRLPSKPPVLLWNSGPPTIHSDSSRQCSSPPLINRFRHFNWVIEDAIAGNSEYRKLFVSVSRAHVLMPFRFGDQYVHFGLHYGATKGMCLTGIDHKEKYQLSNCVRDTFPETMLEMIWLNAIASRRS